MTEIRRCPQCGTELPADAPAGICPNCVFQMGFGSAPIVHDSVSAYEAHAAGSGSAPVTTQVAHGSSNQATFVGGGFLPPAADELAKLLPQLEILELLGKGGMGAVYKARQPTLDRLVAVKVLPPAVAADPTFAERFTREARALARLNHPHIVSVYDFGQVQGLYYFVMEFVNGANLRSAIQAGRLEAKEALAIVPQICEALQYAHDEGVVHRDIKPENILIDKRGSVKIADFGLAKIIGQGTNLGDPGSPPKRDFTLTGTHQVMGTLHYMAPEQIEKPQTVDHRADIYSLGVVFYEMLTGELPIGRFAPPSQKVEMDVRLDEVVLRSLEKEPDRRYQHASDVKLEVESIGHNPAPPPGRAHNPSPDRASGREAEKADLEAARQQVRGPAIGLFWTGLLTVTLGVIFAMWSGWTLQRIGSAPQEKTTTKQGETTVTVTPQLNRYPSRPLLWLILIGQVAAIAVGGLLMQAAASMARFQDHDVVCRWCILAKLPISPVWVMGLPLSLRCQAVLSRPEIREAFDRPVSSGTAGTAGGFQHARGLFPEPWSKLSWATALVSLAGASATFLPWLRLDFAGYDMLLPGYDGWYGIVTGAAFLTALLVFVLAELKQIERTWRIGTVIVAAIVAIILTGIFLYEVTHPRFTSSASGDLVGDSALAQSLQGMMIAMLDQTLRYTIHVGAFVALGCGIVLLGLAMFEFGQRRAGALAWQERWRACPQVVRTIVYSVLCLVYLAATFTFLGFHASDSKSGSRTEIGAPVPWVTSYNQHEAEDGRPVGFAMRLNPLSPSILFGIGGGCAYWLYWKLRIVEEGTISRWESPVIQVILWTICIAIGISVCIVRMLR
jgi:serine/threonine protein kinase